MGVSHPPMENGTAILKRGQGSFARRLEQAFYSELRRRLLTEAQGTRETTQADLCYRYSCAIINSLPRLAVNSPSLLTVNSYR